MKANGQMEYYGTLHLQKQRKRNPVLPNRKVAMSAIHTINIEFFSFRSSYLVDVIFKRALGLVIKVDIYLIANCTFNLGMATRYCTQLGVWESPSFIKCTTEAFIIALSQVIIIKCKFESVFYLIIINIIISVLADIS